MNKTVLCVLAMVIMLSTVSCGRNLQIKEKTYGTYGLVNKTEMCNPDIEYRLIAGNLVLSVILCETVVIPIYFICFSLWEPAGAKGQVEKGVLRI